MFPIDNLNSSSSHLMYIEQTVLPVSDCHIYETSFIDNFICVSTASGKAPTNGDSGSPLILISDSSNASVIIGIMSRGAYREDVLRYPVLYVRVSSYLKWIRDHTDVVL